MDDSQHPHDAAMINGSLLKEHYWRWLCAVVVVGLALRVTAARGGLWLDEAWSVMHAAGVGTPIGVFIGINHDNNHHINSLWMQALGVGAPPMLMRSLSVVTGTAAIVIAASIGARRSPLLGLIAATLFALSPMLVSLGSEARGYAPMTLAMLVAIALVDRWLADPTARSPAMALALCFFLGGLSQLTIVFAFCAIAGWVGLALWHRDGFRSAATTSIRLLLPSVIALALVAALVFVPAAFNPRGFEFGRYDPFETSLYIHGIVELIGFTVGIPVLTAAWLALAVALVVLAHRVRVPNFEFFLLAIIAFPLALAVLQAGNPGHARYHLLLGIALLLLLAELIHVALLKGGRHRWTGTAILAVVVTASVITDYRLAANLRGDPNAAIAALRAGAPHGARVTTDLESDEPVLKVAAVATRYPLAIADCARFFFLQRARHERTPPQVRYCGKFYLPVAEREAYGPSGMHWTLYEVTP